MTCKVLSLAPILDRTSQLIEYVQGAAQEFISLQVAELLLSHCWKFGSVYTFTLHDGTSKISPGKRQSGFWNKALCINLPISHFVTSLSLPCTLRCFPPCLHDGPQTFRRLVFAASLLLQLSRLSLQSFDGVGFITKEVCFKQYNKYEFQSVLSTQFSHRLNSV